MIVTKGGRCLFPTFSAKVTNEMDPNKMYSIGLEVVPTFGTRLRYKNHEWLPPSPDEAGSSQDSIEADPTVSTSTGKLYIHPLSPLSGRIFMPIY
jgi:hypothetical protein